MRFIFPILQFLLALLLPNVAAAADWVALPGAGSADQYFYDRSKLTIKEDEITFWKKVVFKTPQDRHGQTAASGLLRERLNCADHTAKLVSYLYYSAAGETIEYVAQDDSDSAPIIPDTVGDAFERVLCPMVWHKQEEARIKAEQKAAAAELAARKRDEAKPEAGDEKTPPPATAGVPGGKTEQEKPPAAPPGAPLPAPQIIEQLY
ncbi:hypothetical protein GALL_352860 [mine drainage metagenome]|uniref:Surface-adhesin protein E-like domain-containing protein n=1 Tax=mine drainage metagenome TaxID=410659 RepID=A0A1J5QSU3_9ZZZZ